MKAVLWDLDGVLIDSEPGYNITVGELIRSLGYKFGEAEIAKTTGASYKNIAELLGLDEPKEKIERLYIEALLKAINQNVTALIDGAGGFLQELKSRKIKMAIGSSSPRVLVEQIVNKFGLSEFIDIIVTGSDAERGKPAPDIYLKCAELLGVEPANCLVIEDSLNGIKAAKNAAMRVLAFTGTALHNFDLSAADFQIDAYNSDTFKVIEHLLSL
ncbi:MAG: HAD family phosphatase [Oscillospiraceae bacterium]|nr:HAD family phosphatase [Oscillospiraceae bacterium]